MSKKKYLKVFKPCHEPTLIFNNLTLCDKYQVNGIIKEAHRPDVLVPLDSLGGHIWNYLEPNQEIFYYPIEDFGILPDEHLRYLVDKIIKYLEDKKHVCLFCSGGHGRTGYIAACVLGELGIEDPIKYIWDNYCKNAIETSEQVESIINFLEADNLWSYYNNLIEIEKIIGFNYMVPPYQ